ncbi:MAG: hypothetical protein RL657_2786 [Pseudomonadota bacterium]|jgi:hypothetical protein
MSARLQTWHEFLILSFFSGLIYFLAYLSSYQLSVSYEFSHATSWVYLPSGVRLLLVLVLVGPGAFGIVLGTLFIDYLHQGSTDHVYNWITALIAGGSAYLGLKLAQRLLRLQQDLKQLTQTQLMQICLIFSVVSPLMHQIWYAVHGDTQQFWHSAAVMALGDLGGSVIVLGMLYWSLRLVRALRNP